MKTEEIPLVFSCQRETLLGIVHQPEKPFKQGVLAIVAGGPQYRGGCCRQLLNMARLLSSNGIPVMRFDYRGIGDSGGDYPGFEHMGDDLDVAINEFLKASPGLEEVVLWGGCDAAAASMIHGSFNANVSGMILGNPWVHTEQSEAKVMLKHYYWERIRSKSFWLKFIRMEMNPLQKLGTIFSTIKASRSSEDVIQGDMEQPGVKPDASLPFPQRMLAGLQHFNGRILLFMSGKSLVSKEFDELVAASTAWQQAMDNSDITRVDLPEADQAFSDIAAQNEVISEANHWLLSWVARQS